MEFWKYIEYRAEKKNMNKAELHEKIESMLEGTECKISKYGAFAKKFREGGNITLEEFLQIAYVLDIDVREVQLIYNEYLESIMKKRDESVIETSEELKEIASNSRYNKPGAKAYCIMNQYTRFIFTINNTMDYVGIEGISEDRSLYDVGEVKSLKRFLDDRGMSVSYFDMLKLEDAFSIVYEYIILKKIEDPEFWEGEDK